MAAATLVTRRTSSSGDCRGTLDRSDILIAAVTRSTVLGAGGGGLNPLGLLLTVGIVQGAGAFNQEPGRRDLDHIAVRCPAASGSLALDASNCLVDVALGNAELVSCSSPVPIAAYQRLDNPTLRLGVTKI